MPDYLIKNVEKTTVDALKLLAKEHGRTFQEELRAILSAAADETDALSEFELVGPSDANSMDQLGSDPER